MRTFIEDVVVLIIDSHDHSSWWPRDLLRLARISSVWVQPVRKLLYACPTLTSYRSCHLLARTLDENVALVPLVRALDLRPSISDWTRRDEETYDHDTGVCMRSSVSRLLAVTRLERLTLAGDLAEGAERVLRAVASPHTVTALRIEGERGVHDESRMLCTSLASLEWSMEIAERFRALKSLAFVGPLTLDIDNSGYDPYVKDLTLAGAHYCMLEELYLEAIIMAPMSGGLFSLLSSPAAWQRLRKLSIVADDFMFELNCFFLITVLGTSLENFTYQDSTGGLTPPFTHIEQNSVVSLTSLQALDTCRVVRLLDVKVSPSWLRELAAALSCVEDLEVTEAYAAKIPLDAWAQFIGSLSPKCLKTLTLGENSFKPSGFTGSPEQVKALDDACCARGIKLRRKTNFR